MVGGTHGVDLVSGEECVLGKEKQSSQSEVKAATTPTVTLKSDKTTPPGRRLAAKGQRKLNTESVPIGVVSLLRGTKVPSGYW